MSKKKVITVAGDNSKWYDKVIFVVKNEREKDYSNVDFVLEAEHIISDYMLNANMKTNINASTNKTRNHPNYSTSKTNKNAIDIFLYSSICVCIFLMSILIFQSF